VYKRQVLFESTTSPLLPVSLDSFANGDNVVTYGTLQPAEFNSISEEYSGTPIASLITARGSFSRYEGETASTFDIDKESFVIALSESQSIDGLSQLLTLLPISDGAVLINSKGELLPSTILDIGMDIEVEGSLKPGETNSLDAFIAIIDTTTEIVSISGMASEIDLVKRRLKLVNDTIDYCVAVNDATNIQLIDSTEDSSAVDNISLDALLDAEIEVTGSFLFDRESRNGVDTECINAETIILDISSIL